VRGPPDAAALITEIEQHDETGSLAYAENDPRTEKRGLRWADAQPRERERERRRERKGEECDGSRTYISPLI